MAKIKIQGHTSCTGILTIAAPNTNTDRTVTIPDSSGTLLNEGSTLDATKLSGVLPALDGSALTGTGSPSITDNGNATAITIDSSENVGIGTSSPSYRLEVDGTTDFGAATTWGNGDQGKITWSGTKFQISAVSTTSVTIGGSEDAEHLTVNSAGNVGIGEPSPARHFHAKDPNGGNIVALFESTDALGSISIADNLGSVNIGSDAGDMTLSINGNTTNGGANTEAMRIDSSGKVGIGKPSAIGAALQIDPATNVSTTFGSPLVKVGGDNSWVGSGLFSIGFGYTDAADGIAPAEIGLLTTSGAVKTKGALVFATRDVTTSTAPTERMRIHSSGQVGISSGIAGDVVAEITNTNTTSGFGLKVKGGGTDADRYVLRCDDAAGNERLRVGADGKVGIGTSTPAARLDLGALTSNTPGGNGLLKLGDHQFRQMTSGEDETLCLDRNMNGTPAVSMAWRPNTGDVGINTIPGAAAKLIIKSGSLTQAQLKFFGVNYSYGSEMMHQNGSEGGTVGNTRGWYKHDIVTLGNTRRMWTASSQNGTDTQYWSINNVKRLGLSDNGFVQIANFSATGVTKGAEFNAEGKLTISSNTSGSTNLIGFYNTNINVGNIISSGSSTSYSTSSDYRLKENVVPMVGSIDRLKALKPSHFNFIADADTTVDGFLAHEAQEVVPEAVIGTKDAMRTEEYEVTPAIEEVTDEEGNELTPAVKAIMGEREVPDMQGIDQSKLVPLLTAALQEAITKIEELTTRIETLEVS